MVTRKIIISLAAAATLGIAVPAVTNVAEAFMGNMMNPGRWFDDDDDDRYYGGRYGRYGYGGPYGGYGGGPYGWGGPYGGGWGGGPYGGGWGGGPYGGYGGYGGGQPSTIVVNPSSDSKPAPKLPE